MKNWYFEFLYYPASDFIIDYGKNCKYIDKIECTPEGNHRFYFKRIFKTNAQYCGAFRMSVERITRMTDIDFVSKELNVGKDTLIGHIEMYAVFAAANAGISHD
jgi:hypothetical protein